MNLLTSLVLAETSGQTTAASPLVQFLPLLAIGAAFYFLIIRPQRRRQSEQQALLRRVGPGDEIITIGGFHGTVVGLTDDTMDLEIADGVVVTMARNAISRTLTEPAPLTLDDLDDDDDFDDDEYDDELPEPDEDFDDDLGGDVAEDERDR